MRKKSHISLAVYLVENLDERELSEHKKAFCLGSILPDCKPSFLTTRHEFEATFEMVQNLIWKLTEGFGQFENNMRAYFRLLGQVVHYLADYFTYPHNDIYEGSLKEHCLYEKELKGAIKHYIQNEEAERSTMKGSQIQTPETICAFIGEAHQEYIQMRNTIEEDCSYIVNLCQWVVDSILSSLRLYQTAEASAV